VRRKQGMPELPDVEMMRRYLVDTSLNKKIETVDVLDNYVIKKVQVDTFESRLKGTRFQEVERRGKFLEVFTDSRYDLAIHFGMTGYLKYVNSQEKRSKYVRTIFGFKEHDLRYVSKRKLGGLYLVEDSNFDSISTIQKMGPEPLDDEFTFEDFKSITEGRSAMTKSLLLDQSFIAGIGNVYGDEILFQAGIRPDKKISDLNQQKLHTLFEEIKHVLKTVIQHEIELQNLKQTFLTPHRHSGGKCPKCGSSLKKMKISSRTSYWCDNCQK
ncbi:MAG: Fpg/Nei family DNA glycosylase, partial [Thermoproteota archaeon]